MKTSYYTLIAMLALSLASLHAQITSFTVGSDSGSDQHVQILGLITSPSALVDVRNSNSSWAPSYNGFTAVSGFYATPDGSGATIVSYNSSYEQWFSTTITSVASPSDGFDVPEPIYNASGRFFIHSQHTTHDEVTGEDTITEQPSTGLVDFNVGVAGYYSVDVVTTTLSNFGLTGSGGAVTNVTNLVTGDHISTVFGEGSTGLVYLEVGSYRAFVSAQVETDSGVVLVSINH